MRRVALRSLPLRLLHLWRGSLQLRAVAATVVLSTVAVVLIGGFISTTVRDNLFDARRDQVVAEAGRATANAQNEFTSAQPAKPADFEVAQGRAYESILRSISSPAGTTLVAILSDGDGVGTAGIQPFFSKGFDPDTMVSAQLASTLADSPGGSVYSQPLSIPAGDGVTDPAIVTGSVLDVPSAGRYALYLVFDLRDVQTTLDFVQRTIAIGGIALVVLIAAVAYVVVRLIVGPVRVAAEASRRLARGELTDRLPARGEDVLGTLARSFNSMADSIQTQLGQLAALSRLQQRFVSDVSHELRTPLTTIRLAAEVLYEQREGFAPATARTAELLHTQTQRFEALLADLLEMSRFDAGAVQLETEPTNLVPLVQDVLESVRPLAAERGSELVLHAPGGYFEAEVDARRIRRVVQNLLGNAIDHGEGRPIEIWVDSDRDGVAIAVRDRGVGMTEAEAARVFDRFWRADPSRQRRTGGTGLGLAISLEDAALHDGALELWSRPDEGSCFRLTLPRARGVVIERSPIPLPPGDGDAEVGAALVVRAELPAGASLAGDTERVRS